MSDIQAKRLLAAFMLGLGAVLSMIFRDLRFARYLNAGRPSVHWPLITAIVYSIVSFWKTAQIQRLR